MKTHAQRPSTSRHHARNTMAVGLTAREWERLIQYYVANPRLDPDHPGPSDAINAATAAAGRKRSTPLALSFCRDARRLALQRLELQKEQTP